MLSCQYLKLLFYIILFIGSSIGVVVSLRNIIRICKELKELKDNKSGLKPKSKGFWYDSETDEIKF